MKLSKLASKVPYGIICVCALLSSAAYAQTFYVKQDGDDSLDGLSDATAWRTLGRVSEIVRNRGDDVLLKSGSVFEDQSLRIEWGGSEANPASVGCYVVRGDSAVGCGAGDPKPEINGTLEASCRAAKTCRANEAGAVPSRISSGLVSVRSNYVTLENLLIRDSAGRGITANGKNLPNAELLGLKIARVEVRDTFFSAMILEQGIKFASVRDSEFTFFNWCEKNRREDLIEACANGGPWPMGVGIVRSKPSHSVFENNTIYAGAGEGLSCYLCSHVAFRGNRVGNTHSATIYLNHANHVLVEHNLIWGNPANENAFFRGGVSFDGIAISLEDLREKLAGGGSDNLIRNNLIVGNSTCIGSGVEQGSAEEGLSVGARVYGNTCVAQTGKRVVNLNLGDGGAGDWHLENNIFYSQQVDTACRAYSGARFDHNLWHSTPSDSSCRGPNDVVGDPKFENLAALRDVDYKSIPAISDFGLQGDSPARGTGADLSQLPGLGRIEWQPVQQLVSGGISESCTSQLQLEALSVDFNCSPRTAAVLGAVVSPSQPPPAPPRLF